MGEYLWVDKSEIVRYKERINALEKENHRLKSFKPNTGWYFRYGMDKFHDFQVWLETGQGNSYTMVDPGSVTRGLDPCVYSDVPVEMSFKTCTFWRVVLIDARAIPGQCYWKYVARCDATGEEYHGVLRSGRPPSDTQGAIVEFGD